MSASYRCVVLGVTRLARDPNTANKAVAASEPRDVPDKNPEEARVVPGSSRSSRVDEI